MKVVSNNNRPAASLSLNRDSTVGGKLYVEKHATSNQTKRAPNNYVKAVRRVEYDDTEINDM